MSEETFANIHSEPTKDSLGIRGVIHYLTKGGFAKFAKIDDEHETEMQKQSIQQFNEGREGYYGWMGLGGSIF